MKELTVRQMAAIKRVAKNVAPMRAKYKKLCDKIEELIQERDTLGGEIMAFEKGVESITGACSDYFVTRKITKEEIDNKIVSKTEYILTDNVRFNTETGLYEWEEPKIELEDFEEINNSVNNIE